MCNMANSQVPTIRIGNLIFCHIYFFYKRKCYKYNFYNL